MPQIALQRLQVGDRVPVRIVRLGHGRDPAVVSYADGAWERAEELLETGELVELPVESANKGGLLVAFFAVRGFVPRSQIVSLSPDATSPATANDLSQLRGQTLLLKVIEVERKRNRLIFSERAAQRDARKQRKDALLDELRQGERRQATVTSLCDFGAFVDLGGADGLIHLSELSWARVTHPQQVVQVGDHVEVYVLVKIQPVRLGSHKHSQGKRNYQDQHQQVESLLSHLKELFDVSIVVEQEP